MAENERLYEEVEEALNKLFSDQTVSKRECAANMKGIIEDCEIKIESLGDLDE